jgi:hypothetical protein
MKTTYVYACGPIDCWNGWTPFRKHSVTDDKELAGSLLKRAIPIAERDLGFEVGDFKGEIFVAPLPCGDHDCKFMAAWKDHSETTFIASPFRLPWLVSAGARMAAQSEA